MERKCMQELHGKTRDLTERGLSQVQSCRCPSRDLYIQYSISVMISAGFLCVYGN